MKTLIHVVVAAAIAAGLSHSLCAATVIYVSASATGANDGSSWADAFMDLQDALATAQSGDQIWVAAGTYTPGPPDAPLDATSFHFVSGVALYGGFAGGETELEDRDWQKNETILSGDLLGDGSQRVLHVVTGENLEAGSRLDGLAIRDGHASTGWKGPGGGGLRVVGSAIEIMNCEFRDNAAPLTGGGAIQLIDSTAMLDNCWFENNSAERGAGLHAVGGVITIRNCTFFDNEAWMHAGAAYGADVTIVVDNTSFIENRVTHDLGGPGGVRMSGEATFINCTFTGNNAPESTDALSFSGPDIAPASGVLTLDNCLFTGNGAFAWFSASISGVGSLIMSETTIADNTGGLSWSNTSAGVSDITDCVVSNNNWSNSIAGGKVTIRNSVFENNWSSFSGNLVLGWAFSPIDATLIDCRIRGGHPADGGGAIILQSGTLTAINCVITESLGAIQLWGSSQATFLNCTIFDNHGLSEWYPGIFVAPNAHAEIRNSIVWNNAHWDRFITEGQISGPAEVSHSLVQTTEEEPWPGVGNIHAEPLFADADGRLSDHSPAIDGGSNALVPPDITTDLDGNPRIVDGTGDGIAIVDIGAYEFQPKVVAIPGDLNGDGVVDHKDVVILVQSYGPCPPGEECPADLNGDGVVDQKDLLILLSHMTPATPGKPGGAGGGGPP